MTAPAEPDGTDSLSTLLEALVGEAGPASAAFALVVEGEEVRYAEGRRSDGAGLADDCLFDLASLSKPALAWIAAELWREDPELIHRTVAELAPEGAAARSSPVAGASLRELLRHRSGLRPWRPLYAPVSVSDRLEFLLSGDCYGGASPVYSDLGYLLAAALLERVAGAPLAAVAEEWFHDRAPAGSWAVAPVAAGSDRTVVPCGLSTAKEVELAAALGCRVPDLGPPTPGQAQDGNARTLGGFAGHAGLFGTAGFVWSMVREADERGLHRSADGPFLDGWWRPGAHGGAGSELAADWLGHTGFTGGSVWWRAATGTCLILLAHRRSPSDSMAAWRRRFHRLALARAF